MLPFLGAAPAFPLVPPEPSTTKLLLHFDGSNNSTTIVDSSTYARTMTRVGESSSDSFRLKTSGPKFGTAATYHDLVTSGYCYTSDNSDLTIGTQDFTIDCWVRQPADTSATAYICGYQPGSFTTGYFSLQLSGSTNKVQMFNGVNAWLTQSNTCAVTAWNHVALTRSGTSLKLFINGVERASRTDSTNWLSSTNRPYIGNGGTGGGGTTQLDEFRLVIGEAKWTSNFTPPTSAYPTE